MREQSPPAPASPADQLRRNMLRTIVTEPLLSNIRERPDDTFDVIIALNEFYRGGMDGALAAVKRRAAEWGITNYSFVSNYVFARLTVPRIYQLAEESQALNSANRSDEAVVYRIWEDSDIHTTLTRSLTTVKADAAQRAFHALGEGIVWAVLDSGIDGAHPHFAKKETPQGRLDTLNVRTPVMHRDYTPDGDAQRMAGNGASTPTGAVTGGASGAPAAAATPDAPRTPDPSALVDRLGHGTHVAGIIAGHWSSPAPQPLRVVGKEVRDENPSGGKDRTVTSREGLASISGVAPLARLVSLKVIADTTRSDDFRQTQGQGKVSWVLRAIDDIQQWNQHGKRLLVHGVNMSLGYEFDPRWFACGQSPICAEVNRLVRSGVSVVVSAGNSGFASYIAGDGKPTSSYSALSITDPGNAELAITVGSTHRDMPHTYGVSYFSSRGPTGDGRRKPDLLAPGERIRSCAAGVEQARYASAAMPPPVDGTPAPHALEQGPVLYCEQTGTSMAAPHVSGAVAAFLSVRTEFIGQPEQVKALFMGNAIDLGREPTFQGRGLLDLMKVLQAV